MHIANVLWVLGQRRMLAAILFVSGAAGVVAGLVRFQFVPFAQRVAKRQPSVVSVLVAEFRNVVGKILGQILRLFGLD
jgi:hypothetical protein